MPYVNFNKSTMQIISVSETPADGSFIEISYEIFEKIMNGDVSYFHILKHPRNEKYVLSTSEYFDWFRWINHDCDVDENGIYVNFKVTAGTRFIISKRGNGNLIYATFTTQKDDESFFMKYKSPSLDELDVFMSLE